MLENFKKRKLYSSFKDNIWGADLADMQIISRFNKRIRFLLCVIYVFSKRQKTKGKKGATIVKAFQNVLDKSDCKPNKLWVDKISEFYNNSFKKWLKEIT